jgi:hypothetical protein
VTDGLDGVYPEEYETFDVQTHMIMQEEIDWLEYKKQLV